MFTKRQRNSPSLVCVYNHSGNCCDADNTLWSVHFTSSYPAMSYLSMPGDRHNRVTDLTAIATGAGACDAG